MVYTVKYGVNHKKEIIRQFHTVKEHRIDLSYLVNNKSKEEEILDNLNLPFKIKIEKEKKPSVKLPHWTPIIISAYNVFRRINLSDQSDHTPKKDKIVEELERMSSYKTSTEEDFSNLYF